MTYSAVGAGPRASAPPGRAGKQRGDAEASLPAPRRSPGWRYAAALVAIIGCALAAGAFGFMATRSWQPHSPVTRPSLCVTPTTVDGLARCR